jgi:FRG domain
VGFPGVRVFDHDNAADLLEALRPSLPIVRPPRSTIYRGHGQASWKLVPSAFRDSARFVTEWGRFTVGEYKEFLRATLPEEFYASRQPEQEMVESLGLAEFFRAADAAGLPLPEDSQLLREQLAFGTDLGQWPVPSLRSILALSQHHGLPTRLLDWTWDWRVAAYFASIDSLEYDRSSRCAIWALDVGQATRMLERVAWASGKERPFLVEFVTAPGASNPNLRAQQGLFTLLITRRREDSGRALEDVITQASDTDGCFLSLQSHTLPVEQAPQMLHVLAAEGMTAATAFPGYDGVVRSLKERSSYLATKFFGPPNRQISD